MGGVAIVTDAISPGFYFPVFCGYYRRQLPGVDIFVVTPAGQAAVFAGRDCASVVELEVAHYDDTVRAQSISALVNELTSRYDHVLHADCDEFIIADPRRFDSLACYIASERHEYVTAKGFDVVAPPNAPALDLRRRIIGEQRKHAFALYAMNKTCFTRRPLRWGRGFHACDQPPVFDGLYIMHLKRADIDIQVAIGQHLAPSVQNDEFIRNYYLTPRDEIMSFHEALFRRPIASGWDQFDDREFLAAFGASVHRAPDTGLWEFPYEISQKLVEIPAEFHGRL